MLSNPLACLLFSLFHPTPPCIGSRVVTLHIATCLGQVWIRPPGLDFVTGNFLSGVYEVAC